MSVALLDVNVLVALFHPDHIHHEIAHDWFDGQRAHGWATCPITENGFVRLLTNPKVATAVNRPVEIAERLRVFRSSAHHQFWPDSVSLTDEKVFTRSFIRGHKQVTDIYLLGLAKVAGGALATFDRSIPIGAVKGATRAMLQVIGDHAQRRV